MPNRWLALNTPCSTPPAAVAAHAEADACVTGIVGCAGLKPTVAAIKAGEWSSRNWQTRQEVNALNCCAGCHSAAC